MPPPPLHLPSPFITSCVNAEHQSDVVEACPCQDPAVVPLPVTSRPQRQLCPWGVIGRNKSRGGRTGRGAQARRGEFVKSQHSCLVCSLIEAPPGNSRSKNPSPSSSE
ncbi:hypothetical protein QQF64_021937 [Cirrhinus molitorella]|uniref:Uncharacterized protein n=1 Tax=Cirrhinus molitorella TaxID=172907 RepID=A0ABR3LA88_9TELE